MRRLKRFMNLQKFKNKKILIIVIVLLTIAPLIINIGLMFTDVIYSKMGIDLTAKGLNNANWLEFWKDYMSVAIAFLGIYLVWDSSNKDRKVQAYKDSSDQYLRNVVEEEKTLVEVSQCFNAGIIYKALRHLDSTSIQDSRIILQEARDKIDEGHVKFELLTDLSDDFEKCKHCIYNPCVDKRIKKEIRDMFYDMEKHYIDMLNAGEDYVNKIMCEQNNLKRIGIYTELIKEFKQKITYMQKAAITSDEIEQVQQQLMEAEQNLENLNDAKLNQEILEQMIEPIHKEVDFLSTTMRPKFNRYCKCYIDLRKKHASEIRNDGTAKYIKENSTIE